MGVTLLETCALVAVMVEPNTVLLSSRDHLLHFLNVPQYLVRLRHQSILDLRHANQHRVVPVQLTVHRR